MSGSPPIRVIPPEHQQFQHPFNPQSATYQPIHQQIIHRSKITIVRQEDNLPKGCQPNTNRKHIPIKSILHYKRQRYYTMSNVEKIDEDIHEESRAGEGEECRRNNSLERSRKEVFAQEMREINKNYSQFMKEFKKTKPLYLIKEQEFKASESLKFELKREEVLRKLKEYYKPISFQEIDEHEKVYLRNKASAKAKEENCGYECLPSLNQSPKLRNQRERFSTISLEEAKSEQSLNKQQEALSLSKMREQYDRIIDKTKRNGVKNHYKRKLSVRVEPSTAQSSSVFSKKESNRVHSKSINYDSTEYPKTSISLSGLSSPKHKRSKRYSLLKNTIEEMLSVDSKGQIQEEMVQDYHLARFGQEPFQENEFRLITNYSGGVY